MKRIIVIDKRFRIYIIITGLVIFLIFIYSCSFSKRKCEKLLKESMTKSYDVVVIPGCPFKNEQWSNTMEARVCWSKYLYDKGIAKNIIYSGNADYTPYNEAEIMALYGEALGIPKEHIFMEKKAEHSTENIYYSCEEAKKLGFKKIALATDPFQSKLLRSFTRKRMNSDVGIIPIVFDSLEPLESKIKNPAINSKVAFVKDFVPLTERQHLLKRFEGTLGKDIDTNLYK